MVHSVSRWMRGVQVKLWDPLRMRAIPERLRGVFTTRRYTNTRLPLAYLPEPPTPRERQGSLAFCRTPASPRGHRYWASVSRSLSVCFPAFAVTHCTCPRRDGQAELTCVWLGKYRNGALWICERRSFHCSPNMTYCNYNICWLRPVVIPVSEITAI